MRTVRIQQTFSSPAHPALLSDDDIDSLGLLEDAPAGTHLNQPISPTTSANQRSSDRHDAGILTIALTFSLGAIAGGALQEAGKDIYAWVKTYLVKLINKKKEVVRSSTSTYSFKLPEWELEITAKHGDVTGFKASIKVTSAESMEQAMKALTESLEGDILLLEMSHNAYYWHCSQTVAGLQISSNLYEPETK